MSTQLKILLVDDEKAILKILSIVLEDEGYEVITASDGLEARELAGLYQFAAVLTDINMPGSGGLEVLKYLQAKQPLLPVILMTGFTQVIETKAAFELGAKAFIAKPFQPEDLIAILTEVLNPPESTKVIAGLTVGDSSEDFCKIAIDEFISGNTIKFEIFICLAEDKYIKIAHTGENIDMAKIQAFKSKDVHYLYIKKQDFAKYVGFNLSLVNVIKNNDMISKEKKIQMVRHASDVVMENLFMNGLDQPAFNQAKEILESTMSLLLESNESFKLITTLSSQGDHLYAHTLGVSVFSTMIAKQIGWKTPSTLFKISSAGLFHDIGLKEIDRKIVDKPRWELSAEEMRQYETHCARGAEILSRIPSISDEIIQAVLQHHESADGRGYPAMLPAGKINTIARLISVADKFCDLALADGHSPGLPPQRVIERLSLTIKSAVDVQFLEALKKVLGLDERIKSA